MHTKTLNLFSMPLVSTSTAGAVPGFSGPVWMPDGVQPMGEAAREDARVRRRMRLRLARTGLRCLWAAVSGR